MNPVPNRKKLRREYLRKKGMAYSSATIAGLFLFPSCGICVLLGLMAMVCLLALNHVNAGTVFLICLFLAVASAIFGLIARFAFLRVRHDLEMISDLSYVPPVIAESLPAEEVLVRGAEEPSATSETLLRPAMESVASSAEQLLRATNETERE